MTRLEVSTEPPPATGDPGMLTAALATVRTRWAAFAGTFAALALGVSVIAMTALVLAAASGGTPDQRPERFAAAAYVIQVDPNLQVRDSIRLGHLVPLLAQPDVPAPVITQLPGATPDRSFYAQVQGAPAAQPALETAGPPPRSPRTSWLQVTLPARPTRLSSPGGYSRPPGLGGHRSRSTDLHDRPRRPPRTGEQPVSFTDAEQPGCRPGLTHW